MSAPGRPQKGHARLALHVPPEVKKALQLEAIERSMTMSEIVVEALEGRTYLVRHKPSQSQGKP